MDSIEGGNIECCRLVGHHINTTTTSRQESPCNKPVCHSNNFLQCESRTRREGVVRSGVVQQGFRSCLLKRTDRTVRNDFNFIDVGNKQGVSALFFTIKGSQELTQLIEQESI